MRTSERLRKLKQWAEGTLCSGRLLKVPAPKMDILEIRRAEPKCYLAWSPSRPDGNGVNYQAAADSVCPGIIIMPNASHAKYMEEKRFDRYNGVNRPQELGQELRVSMLFSVYEPGTRLPGFIDSGDPKGMGLDMSLFGEGTEQGLFTLIDWMDDAVTALLGQKFIPGTDLFLKEEEVVSSLYTDQAYVVDRRPIYYGFVNVGFHCYAEEGQNPAIEDYLN